MEPGLSRPASPDADLLLFHSLEASLPTLHTPILETPLSPRDKQSQVDQLVQRQLFKQSKHTSRTEDESGDFLQRQRKTTRFLERDLEGEDSDLDRSTENDSIKVSRQVSKTQLKLNLLLHICAGLLIFGGTFLPWTVDVRHFDEASKPATEVDYVFLFAFRSKASSKLYFLIKMLDQDAC